MKSPNFPPVGCLPILETPRTDATVRRPSTLCLEVQVLASGYAPRFTTLSFKSSECFSAQGAFFLQRLRTFADIMQALRYVTILLNSFQ